MLAISQKTEKTIQLNVYGNPFTKIWLNNNMIFNKKCNIDNTDRINRIVIGLILIIATLLNLSWMFYIIAGMILILEGIIGICYIPKLIAKIKSITKYLRLK